LFLYTWFNGIDEIQFDFMEGKGIMEAVGLFIVQQMHKKFRAKI